VLHYIAFANNTSSVPARFLSIKWKLPDSIGVEISEARMDEIKVVIASIIFIELISKFDSIIIAAKN
jgi:hypothetical protein